MHIHNLTLHIKLNKIEIVIINYNSNNITTMKVHPREETHNDQKMFFYVFFIYVLVGELIIFLLNYSILDKLLNYSIKYY